MFETHRNSGCHEVSEDRLIWHFMDLTPQDRGNWYANLDYGTKVHAASS
jgi:hypothetical protein